MGFFQWLFGCRGKPRCFQRWADHDERIDALERKLRSLDGEFTEHYDKTRRMMGRMAKRAAIIEAAEEPEEEALETQPGSSPEGLTPKQLEWNRRIAAERGRLA